MSTFIFYGVLISILLFAFIYGMIKKRLGTAICYLVLIAMTIIILFPLLITVMNAFNNSNDIVASSIIPENFTLTGNFKRLFDETEYVTWYRNTFLISTISMLFATFIITVLGFVYSRFRYKGRNFSLIMLLVVQVIPAGSTLIALYAIANSIGIYKSDNSDLLTYIYLIVIYVTGAIPMNTLLMKGYYDSIPRDLDESAKIDGASSLRIFREILVPLVVPMIATVALFSFLAPIGDVIMPNILIASEASSADTLALGLNGLIADPTNSAYNLFAAGSILIAIPTVLFFFMLQKYVVGGLASGGVKG